MVVTLKNGVEPCCILCGLPFAEERFAVNALGKCCVFCLGDRDKHESQFSKGPEKPVVRLNCGHSFCQKCLVNYLEKAWCSDEPIPEKVMCPGLYCKAAIDVSRQCEIALKHGRELQCEIALKHGRELEQEKGIQFVKKFHTWCNNVVGMGQNPWKMPCPNCKSCLDVGTQALLNDCGVTCPQCTTTWYGQWE